MADESSEGKEKGDQFSEEGYRPIRDDILAEPTKPSLKSLGGLGSDSSGSTSSSDLPKLKPQGKRPEKPKVEDSKEELLFDRIKWLAVGLICVLAVGVFGIILYNAFFGTEVLDEGAGSDLSDLLDPELLTEAYVDANGGEEFLRSLVSIRATGKITNSQGEFEFYLLKRIPNKTIYRLDIDRTTVTVGTDGEDAWRSVSLDGKIRDVVLLEGEEADSVRDNARFFGGLMDFFLEGQGELDELSLDETGESPLIRISVINEDRTVSDFFVDPESLDLVKSETRVDGTVRTELYSDYRSLLSFRQPFVVETIVNDERESLLALEEATINPGVLSISFEVPETTAVGLQEGQWSMEEDVRLRQLAE
ncbi:MAG: hypothetical protein AAGJ81_10350 [Verrucomicrobiota bacterium]